MHKKCLRNDTLSMKKQKKTASSGYSVAVRHQGLNQLFRDKLIETKHESQNLKGWKEWLDTKICHLDILSRLLGRA